MRQFFWAAIFCLAFVTGAYAQQSNPRQVAAAPAVIIDVWPGAAPGSENWRLQEIISGEQVRNVTRPTLTVYLPEASRATGAAIILAPGGGFNVLNTRSQGADVARWFAARGITALVLKYRTRQTPVNEEEFRRATAGSANRSVIDIVEYSVADAIQALAVTRDHAQEWGIDPNRIGLLGFSAGAIVAEGALLHNERANRPAFVGLLYGGLYQEGLEIPRDLPPVFGAVAVDDTLALQSMGELMTALMEAGVRPEFHVYSGGGHGFALDRRGTTSDGWTDTFYAWLETKGLLRPRSR